MNAVYDIFRNDPKSKIPVWVETVVGLEQAKQRMKALAAESPGEYLLWNSASGQFLKLD